MRIFYIALLLLCSFSSAIAQQKPVYCGTSDDVVPKELLDRMARLPAIMESQRARTAAGEMRICRMAIEIDYATYSQLNGDTNLITRKVLQDIAKVSEVYEKEINTRVVVSGIRIWKDPNTDPFRNATNTYHLLDILANLPPANFEADKRMLLYAKLIDGPQGVAYLGGMYNVSVLGIPQMIMHEIGHNFGSPHTHSCNWPGGPIDFCASIEGSCYDQALGALAKKEGTIMSYCNSMPTFHPLCQALMKNFAENALSNKIDSAPAAPQLAANDAFSRGDFFNWKTVLSALSYEVSLATHSDFSDARTVKIALNGLQIKDIPANAPLYVKVRAVNTFGNSDWSAPVALQAATGQLPAPEIDVLPESQSIFSTNTRVRHSYQAVPGATGYEVQVTSGTDPEFQFSLPILSSSTLSAEYLHEYSGIFRWRVRAVNGNQKGRWSELGYYAVNPALGNQFVIPFTRNLEDVPTSFPFSYFSAAYYSKIVVTVSANSDFSNPLFKREYSTFWGAMDVVSGLPFNSSLFLRVEEWNEDEEQFPKRKVADFSFPFRTGTTVPSQSVKFLSGIEPNVFNLSAPKVAITDKSIWFESPSYGFVRLDKSNFTYQVYNRENTAGLIGNTYIAKPLLTDSERRINVVSQQSNGILRRVVLPSDAPGNDAQVNRFYSPGDIEGSSPAHRLYWNRNGVYRESNQVLTPVIMPNGGRYFRQVTVAGNRIFILHSDFNANAEVIQLDAVSGNEMQRFSSANYPALLSGIEEIAANSGGQILAREYDSSISGYRVTLWKDGKWTSYSPYNANIAGNIQSIAVSPKGEFYVLTRLPGHRIYRYENSQWKEIANIRFQDIAFDMLPDTDDNIWLTGRYGIIRVTATPFEVISSERVEYCAGDSVRLRTATTDITLTDKVFTAVLTKPGGETVSVNDLEMGGNRMHFKLPAGFTGDDVTLRVKMNDTGQFAPTSLTLKIRLLPTATISVDKSELIPQIDTATVTIALTGEKPWIVFLSNRDSIYSELPLHTTRFVLPQPVGFELSPTRVTDRYCSNEAAGNVVRITPVLVTGIAEPSWPKVSVYPNPSSGRVLIEHEQQNSKPLDYHLSDLKGTVVGSKQVHGKLTEWDISKLGAGTYVLWTVQNGSKRAWRVVKN